MTRTSATSTDALIDADWLELHLTDPDVRVVEVDVSAARHESGHIPGAVLWNVYSDLKDDGFRPRPAAELAALVDRSGIEPGSTVVTYGYAPALGYWLLRVLGHDRVRVLDTATWQAEGRPWTSRPSQPVPSGYRPAPTPGLRADLPAVTAMVGDPSGTLLDVRSEAEYVGERFWPSGGIPDGGRAGHIPGAVHLPADLLTTSDGALRPVGELRELLADVDREQPVVTYCTVGARAATVWFALSELLGHPDVRVYDGSWAQWGMDPARPVATGRRS
jgi:thiosulfate/3-mercaptopyruvate sulfurtransferase